jgi:hypothetical protein
MGGANFEIFSCNGGQLFLPADADQYPGDRGEGLSRTMVPGLQLQGPCVIIYLDGDDAARMRQAFNLPAPAQIAGMTLDGGIAKP